jgi:hypothetical protein
MTPELLNRISQWRTKAADGSITKEELKEAIVALRESRVTAMAQPTSRPRGAKKAQVNSANLFAEFDSL